MNSEKWHQTFSLAVLCSLVVSILSPVASVSAAPPAEVTQQSPPFTIRGQVLDVLHDDGGQFWSLIKVFVTYKDPNSGQELGTSALDIQPDGNWEFNENPDVPLDQWPLPDIVTFDVTLYVPSDMVVPVEAQAGSGGTVQAADHIVLDRVSRGTYQGNIFYTDASELYTTLAGCPIEHVETTHTDHFVIRWCNDSYHSNYPPGGDAGLSRGGEST